MKFRLTLIAAVMVLASSCNKSDSDTIYNYLKGNWRLVQSGADINGNGIMEDNELITLPESTLTTTFNADGTGQGNINFLEYSVSNHFKWSTNERNQIVTIITESNLFDAAFKVRDRNNFTLSADLNNAGLKIWGVYQRN